VTGLVKSCTTLIFPSWSNSWVECRSVIHNGRCMRYGHKVDAEEEDVVITFHPSEDGRTDYLEVRSGPDWERYYGNRPAMRKLAEEIMAAPDITPGPSVMYRDTGAGIEEVTGG